MHKFKTKLEKKFINTDSVDLNYYGDGIVAAWGCHSVMIV